MTSRPEDSTTIPSLTDASQLREHMPVIGHGLYLDHAAMGVLPQPVADAMRERIASGAVQGVRHWNRWQKMLQRTRRLAAQLIGGLADEVAFIPNTATGIGTVAEGYRWQDGDNVVLSAAEFPSNRFPWLNLQRRGVEVRLVEVPDDADGFIRALDDACDSSTRIVTCSWVDYTTGVRRDPTQLAEVAHRYGALLVLDAIQGLGVLSLDIHAQNIDVLVADSRKWLLGPEAAGIFAIQQHCQERFDVTRSGWASASEPMNFNAAELELSAAASRFESGMQNTYGISGLNAALRLLHDIPIGDRESSLLHVRALFAEAGRTAGLQTTDVATDARSGIIVFQHPDIPSDQLARHLRVADVTVSLKGDYVRVSPHFYNNAEDAQAFTDALASLPHD